MLDKYAFVIFQNLEVFDERFVKKTSPFKVQMPFRSKSLKEVLEVLFWIDEEPHRRRDIEHPNAIYWDCEEDKSGVGCSQVI